MNIFLHIRGWYDDRLLPNLKDDKHSRLVSYESEDDEWWVSRALADRSNHIFVIQPARYGWNIEDLRLITNKLQEKFGVDIYALPSVTIQWFTGVGMVPGDVYLDVWSNHMWCKDIRSRGAIHDWMLVSLEHDPRDLLYFDVYRAIEENIPLEYREILDTQTRAQNLERGRTTHTLKLRDGRIAVSCELRPKDWDRQAANWLYESVMIISKDKIQVVHTTREPADNYERRNDGVTGLYLSRSRKSLVIKALEGRWGEDLPPNVVTTYIKLT